MINEEALIRLLLDINTQTQHTVFFRVFGHINKIEIDFHEGGWENNKENSKKYEFKVGNYEAIKIIYDIFKEILKRDSVLGFDKECGF